ncbi:MAG: hypothetical protein ACNI22_16675 [Halarcobacter sp.]
MLIMLEIMVRTNELVKRSAQINSKLQHLVFDIDGISKSKGAEKIKITIEVTDKSNWNLFQGK